MKKVRRAIRYYLLKFLRLRGTPWKVALGFAVGACVNFYPTFGAGVLFAGLLASAFRVSITAALLGDLIFKSLFPIFFYFNLVTGNFVSGQRPKHLLLSMERILSLRHLNMMALKFFGRTFMIGAFVNTLILGTILTSLVYLIFRHYRVKLAHLVFHWGKR